MCRVLLAIVLLTCVACAPAPQAPAVKNFTTEELDERLNRKTPEGTLRVLVIGMQVADAELIESLTGPLPKSDLPLLLSKERPSLSKEIQLQQGAALKILHLQPGEKIPLDDGREFTVPAPELDVKSQWLMIETIPVPLQLFKIDDHWQVDITPLLAARRAAKLRVSEKNAQP